MAKALDLTGQVFKTWEVIEKLPSRNGKVYWLCKCKNCGQFKEVQTSHLRQLTVGSCSCCPKEKYENHQGLEPRVCEICGKTFIPMNIRANTRKYCYECSPHEDENCTHAQAVTIKRRAIKKALVQYKGGCCQRCGYNKSLRALEFHHLDPTQKDFHPSKYLTRSFAELKTEVDKCILLCSNCHAEEHERLENEESAI